MTAVAYNPAPLVIGPLLKMSAAFVVILLLRTAMQASAAREQAEQLECSFSGAECWVQDATEPKGIEARIADFQEQFRRIGIQGEVDHCDTLVEESIGRETAYGGVCVLRFEGETRAWLVCDDSLVGNWAADFGTLLRPKTRRRQVIFYTRDHCLGA